MANLAFRSAASDGDSSFGSTTDIATVPSGAAQNDLEQIWYSSAAIAPAAAPTHTTPSGWTLPLNGSTVANGVAGGALNVRLTMYYRIAPATPANATLTSSAAAAHAWTRLAHDNPDTAAPFGQVTFGTFTGTSVIASSITTTKANALLSMYVAQGAAQALTPASGMTERLDNATQGIEFADAIQAVAGATGTKTATAPASTDGVWGFAEFWSETTAGGPAGIATETDAAQGLAGKHVRLVGLASDTSAAFARPGVQVRAVGLAVESSVGLALTPKQIRAVGVAAEAGVALQLLGMQNRAVGLVLGTETALALNPKQIRAAGMAGDVAAALSLLAGGAGQVGAAAEGDSAFALAGVQRRAVGIAIEADFGIVLPGLQRRAAGLTTSQHLAFSLAGLSLRTAGVAIDSAAALALAARQLVPVGRADSFADAFALVPAGAIDFDALSDEWAYDALADSMAYAARADSLALVALADDLTIRSQP